MCGSEQGDPLESGLIDAMVTPPTGPWSFTSCGVCEIGYLTPRPTPESIKKAYGGYYTHTSGKDDLVPGKLRQLKDTIANKYYAASSKSGSYTDRLAYIAIRIIFPFALLLDAKSRHIFKVQRRPGRLLDIGCGNGEFMRFARKYGWEVVGIDFDEKAVKEAASSGLDVRLGGVEAIGHDEKFDFVSMSHVIEHVHDPEDFVLKCFAHLEDGGVLWLETPNIAGMGRSVYGPQWRGYEPPRHLVLFNGAAVENLLSKVGFVAISQKLHGLAGLYMGLSSERMASETNVSSSVVVSVGRKLKSIARIGCVELLQLGLKEKREFLTYLAFKSQNPEFEG